jgi:hypothetical protein
MDTTAGRAWNHCANTCIHCTDPERLAIMSYYFTIIGTKDNPLFEHEFGTSKPGGDGTAKFREEAAHMNQFIVHAALDIVEEVQWGTKDLWVISHV